MRALFKLAKTQRGVICPVYQYSNNPIEESVFLDEELFARVNVIACRSINRAMPFFRREQRSIERRRETLRSAAIKSERTPSDAAAIIMHRVAALFISPAPARS